MSIPPTYVGYSGDGVTKDFVFPFPYMLAAHIRATVGGTETTAFTFIATSTIRFTSAPAAGTGVLIYRETPAAPITTWVDGALILGKDLGAGTTQGLYLAQEAFNRAWDALRGNAGPVDGGNASDTYNTPFPQGWVGPQGPPGPQGAVGATGAAGANGINGTTPDAVRIVVFSTADTWTKPAGLRRIRVTVQAGGGSGGGIPAVSNAWSAAGSGGSGGACISASFEAASLPGSIGLGVGAGGAAVVGGHGNWGNDSWFGSLLWAKAGRPGILGTPIQEPDSGESALGTPGSWETSWDASAMWPTATQGGHGDRGLALYGYNSNTVIGGRGGNAKLGTGGGLGSCSDNYGESSGGWGGSGYGVGGGGASASGGNTAQPGGVGLPGLVIVEEFY